MKIPDFRNIEESARRVFCRKPAGYDFHRMRLYLRDMKDLMAYKNDETHKEELKLYPGAAGLIDDVYKDGAENYSRDFAGVLHNSTFLAAYALFEAMMTKSKTAISGFLVYLMMVPVCAAMLISFGRKQHEVEPASAPFGKNRRMQKLPEIAPVDLTKVTRVVLYGEIMDHSTNKASSHTGIDFELSSGSDVLATGGWRCHRPDLR